MKKFWKIRIDSDIRKSLEFLSVNKDYICIMVDKTSDLMKYKEEGGKYFLICYDDLEPYLNYQGWGWGEESDFSWFSRRNFFYCGEVNLRKEKLKKIEYGREV